MIVVINNRKLLMCVILFGAFIIGLLLFLLKIRIV